MDFQEVMELQRSVDGMMMDVTASAWCALLEAQHEAWGWGESGPVDYLEIGTFKGKSASILAWFASVYGNSLAIVDPVITRETKDLLSAIAKVSFMEQRSEFLGGSELQRSKARSIGFCHIDGMHTFAAVQSDMQACEPMLSDFGIMCLDDIFTELYPQVTAAVFDYLSRSVTDLVPFLIGFNKIYLCRNQAFPYYQVFSERHLVHTIRSMGHGISVVKTDSNSRFDAVSMAVEQDEVFYGRHFRTITQG